jgi:hypothetical protein
MSNNKYVIQNEIKNLLGFNEIHKDVLANDTTYTQSLSRVKEIDIKLDRLIPLQDITGKPFTEEKEGTKKKLIEECDVLNSILKGYGKINKFNVFREVRGCSAAQLSHCSEGELIQRSRKLLVLMAENTGEAEAAGISDEMKQSLDGLITTFGKQRQNPINFREKRSEITDQINGCLKEFSQIVNGGLKTYMRGRYSKTEPAMYALFLQAFQVYRKKGHSHALAGNFYNGETGESLRRVKVTVDDDATLVKGGDKGGYFFHNLTPGIHELTFSRKGYETVTKTIRILPDQTLELDISLLPLPIEAPVEQ